MRRITCPHCSHKPFKTERGFRWHLEKAHGITPESVGRRSQTGDPAILNQELASSPELLERTGELARRLTDAEGQIEKLSQKLSGAVNDWAKRAAEGQSVTNDIVGQLREVEEKAITVDQMRAKVTQLSKEQSALEQLMRDMEERTEYLEKRLHKVEVKTGLAVDLFAAYRCKD